MITLNGKQFARAGTPAPDAAVGFYKPHRSSIVLMNRDGAKIGVINKHGCLLCATLMNDRFWYNFATIREIGQYASYLQSVDEPRAALREHCGVAA